MKFFSKISGDIRALKSRSLCWRILLNKYSIITILFIVWICFIDNNSIGVWFRTRSRLKEQEKQMSDLNAEIAAYELRIEQLNSQKDTLERFAREEYLFHEEGEDVYVIE